MNRISTFSLVAIGCLLAIALAGRAWAANQRAVSFGTTLPATCYTGDLFFKTNATAGSNVYACVSTNTWVTQGVATLGGDVTGQTTAATVTQIQGRPVSSTAPASGQALTWNSSTSRWEPTTVSGGGATTLAGDVVGSSSSTTVTQIQGRPIVSTAPSNGQALVWNASTTRWEPQTISGGGGGGGASMAAQLGDFAVSQTSGTVLTVGPNCSFTTPCNVRIGALAYTLTNPITVTLSSGTGNVYIYFASTGALTVGHNMIVSCSGSCTAPPGITAFPADAVPLYTWHATSGAWDATGTDQRAFLSSKNVIPGAGLMATELAGQTTIAADPSIIGLRVSVPGTSATACTTGSWAMDTSFYYLCVTTNSWRRATMSSW